MNTRRRVWLGGAIIVVAVLAAYANGWTGPFVFDDEPSILENATIRQLWPLSEPLSPPKDFGVTVSGRPVLNLSLALNYAISGMEPWSYHGFNVIVHGLAALVLLGVVRRTLRKPLLAEKFGEHAEWTASVVALLWALHPLQTESVTYVIQRAESLMGLFFLLTLYAFIRATESKRPAVWLSVMLASAVLGMGCKEVMATGPLIVLLYDRTFVGGSFRAVWRERRGWHGLLLLSWLPLGWLVMSAGGNRGGTFTLTWAGCRDYWLTQFGAVTHYLRLTVWPEPLVFDYGTFWVRDAGALILPALVVLGLLGATLWALLRRPMAGFLGATFFVILAPTSLVPGTIQMIVEHRMYLSLAAVLALTVGVGVRVGGRAALWGFAGVAVVFGALTWRRNLDYASDLRLWSDTVTKRPASAIAQGNLGTAHYRRGQLTEAIACYAEALRLGPVTAQMHYNLGLALDAAGRGDEAMVEYAAAVKILPYFAQAHVKRARLLLKGHKADEAVEPLRQALSYLPDWTEARYMLGLALSESDRPVPAAEAFARVLKDEPNHADAELQWGVAEFRRGRIAEAERHLRRALMLRPASADAHYNLGLVLAAAWRADEAEAQYREVVRLDPLHASARLNLGVLLAQAGKLVEAKQELEVALRADPQLAAAHGNLGIVSAELGRPEEAVGHYESALKLRPDYPEMHYNLGNALVQLRRYTEARAQFSEAVRLRPEFAAAREMLERMATVP
jgi:tetratricopeptide (TPR) repeat protein